MSKITDAEANATSLDGLVNDNALVPTLRNGPKPSYQYLVDGWDGQIASKITELNKSRGFRVIGAFADGFTYELFNDVGIDTDGNSWIYTGAGAPNKVVNAGTVPSAPDYEQVTFNTAENVQMTSGESVQKFTTQSRQAIEALYKSQGYNNVFFFKDGFTYTEPNDVGIYEDGTAWTYVDSGALPVAVAAGTNPVGDVDYASFNLDKNFSRSFNNLEDVKNGVNKDGSKINMNLLLGAKIDRLGYYSTSDGGSNWGIVKFGPHVDDGGKVTTISGDLYVEWNMVSGKSNIRKWGAAPSMDSTQQIRNALNHLKPTGGTLSLTAGSFATEFIDLREFSNIEIKGESSASPFPYVPVTTLTILSPCAVAIQLNDSGVEIPPTQAKGVLLRDFYLNCDSKANFGINCKLAVKIENLTIRNAILDGIVLEGSSYPVHISNTVSQYNGRHGIYVKAPFTTVYNIKSSEFGFNDGYGMYLEDGSTCLIQDVLLQSNKKGGLRILQQDPSGYSKPIFLERLTFINLYTEANGTLDVSDPTYDGNYAVKINGLNADPSTFSGKIVGITFINCSINKSSSGQIASIVGTDRLVRINTNSLYGTIKASENIIDNNDCERGDINFFLSQSGGSPAFTKVGSGKSYFERKGNQVTCYINYSWSDKGGVSGSFFASANTLPFIPRSSGYLTSSPVEISVLGGSSDRWVIMIEAGSVNPRFRKNGDSGGIGFATVSELPDAGQISGVFTYLTGAI